MKASTLAALKTLMEADSDTTPELVNKVISVCKSGGAPRKLITSKRAMEILEVSVATFYDYISQGMITQIRRSPRKIRYDQEQIELLANHGAPTMTTRS